MNRTSVRSLPAGAGLCGLGALSGLGHWRDAAAGWLWRAARVLEGRLLQASRRLPRGSAPTPAAAISPEIAAARDGDSDAFARLVEAHQAEVARQMTRFTRDHLVLEELVHEVFVEAYFSLASFRGQAPLLHWLRKLAVRVGYRYWKRRERERAKHSGDGLAEAIQLAVPDTATLPQDAADRLADVLGQLAPRDRLVLTLLYWDDCSVAEAAELSGWSPTMVKVQAHRARRRLRKLLESAEGT